jgi:hypothetical protein
MSKTLAPQRCPTHARILRCPACIGQKGGQRTSPAKTKAARKNARRSRPRAATEESAAMKADTLLADLIAGRRSERTR